MKKEDNYLTIKGDFEVILKNRLKAKFKEIKISGNNQKLTKFG